MQGPFQVAGLRVPHATRLPHVQIQAYQPHGSLPRGAVARHPRDPFGFLHGRVRLQEDAHPVMLTQGRGTSKVDRDQVMSIMRGFGVQGVRRGGMPVTTKPAKGTGGRPDLVDRKFEVRAPNRLHVADITYVRMANGSFGCTAAPLTCSPEGSSVERAPRLYEPRICRYRCRGKRCRGPLNTAAPTVSCTTAITGRGASASYAPQEWRNTACFPRPTRSATRTTTSWPSPPTARARPCWHGDVNPSRSLTDLERATFRWVSW